MLEDEQREQALSVLVFPRGHADGQKPEALPEQRRAALSYHAPKLSPCFAIAPSSLLGVAADFLNWQPIPPNGAKQISARLCRLLLREWHLEAPPSRNSPRTTGTEGPRKR